jgi:hypothetical protein
METWLSSSRRFTAFVAASRDKIRKKLRVTKDVETLYDLQLELETAFLLLRERSLSVVYEPEQSRQVRSPDFSVTFTTSLTFMVEVTRLRDVQKRTSPEVGAQWDPALDKMNMLTVESERLADAVCSKLGQFLSGRSNVLVIGVDSSSLKQSDLHAAMLRVKQRAEGNNPAFWQRYGFQERADFFNYYQRLSEVLMRESRLQAGEPVSVWVNAQAKHPLPGKVRTALYRSHKV